MPVWKRLLAALALSCCIYQVPIFSAHWAALFGVALGQELLSDREAAWKVADFAFALLTQAALFACAWWVVPRSRLAALGLTVLLLVPGVVLVNLVYFVVIPSYFLIESDSTPGLSSWKEMCVVEGYSLDPVRQGITRPLDRRGEAFVRQDNGAQYGILRLPGCTVEPVAIPALLLAYGLQQVLPDGTLVYSTMDRQVPGQKYWLLRRGAKEPRRLDVPSGDPDVSPLVSEDGEWVSWVTRSPQREASLRIAPLDGGEPILFTHPLLQRATIALVELDMKTRQVTLNRDLSTFVRLGLDGHVVWGPLQPGEIAAQSDTFRYADGQWAGWDAYVEKSRYRLRWS